MSPATVPSIVATAADGVALQLLDALLAQCPALQARAGATNPEDTAKHIFWPFLVEPEPAQRPYVVVFSGPNDTEYELQSGGSGNNLLPHGTLNLLLCDNDRFTGDRKASLIDFENFTGGVLQYLADQSAIDGQLSIVGMSRTVPPMYPSAFNVGATEEERPFWWCQWAIEWGALAH